MDILWFFIAGVLTGMAAFALVVFLADRHEHRWEEVARDYMERRAYRPLKDRFDPAGQVTLITYQCTIAGCGKFKQKTLQGWVGKAESD